MRFGRMVGVKYYLGDAPAIIQVDKGDSAMVTIASDPSVEGDDLIQLSFSQLSAGMCALQFHILDISLWTSGSPSLP